MIKVFLVLPFFKKTGHFQKLFEESFIKRPLFDFRVLTRPEGNPA
ncbi:hypothetical protein MSKU15_2586 [Komagataeibacter diospyri]|nr:hypothetical protein MSKU15_2586 [Komagataeibacter diospyri]